MSGCQCHVLCLHHELASFSYRIPSPAWQVLFSGEVMPTAPDAVEVRSCRTPGLEPLRPDRDYLQLCTLRHFADRDFAPDEALPIGRAFTQRERVFLLDENDAPGRRARAGRGRSAFPVRRFALGYHVDPVRTAQAFTQNPLNTNWWRKRIYRTGDLARYDESGSLYYIGRRDFGSSTWDTA